MANEIYEMIDGRSSMGFVGETPWHGLGQRITDDAPLDVWAQEAGLNWEIKTGDCSFKNEQETLITIPNKQALYRSDNGEFLSLMSDRYKIVQPAEILDFYNSLIQTGGFKINTAGSVFRGRKIWALAEKAINLKGICCFRRPVTELWRQRPSSRLFESSAITH